MGKLTISMAIFNSYVKLPEGIFYCIVLGCFRDPMGPNLWGLEFKGHTHLFSPQLRPQVVHLSFNTCLKSM